MIRPLLPQHHRFDDVPLNERKEYDRPGGARLAFVFTINVNSLMYGYAPQIMDKIRRRSEKIVGHGRSNAENHPWHVRSRRHVPDGLADGRSTYLDAQIITHRKQDASEFCVLTEQSERHPLVMNISVHPHAARSHEALPRRSTPLKALVGAVRRDLRLLLRPASGHNSRQRLSF